MYIFFGLFSDDKTICYIFVISLCAFDFWTVKNVTGRILVGLRWWSTIREDGKEEWNFEAIENNHPNKVDTRIFWSSQYLFGAVWVIFGVVSLLSFAISNFTVCAIAGVLNITNTMGYIKCDKKHQKSMGSFMFNKAKNNLSTG